MKLGVWKVRLIANAYKSLDDGSMYGVYGSHYHATEDLNDYNVVVVSFVCIEYSGCPRISKDYDWILMFYS